eukprot:m.14443 g.14443  ORF g.14443 m.14443 type:complete len:199 (+) comp10283_c0_seq1:211-807(+)
MSFNSAAAHQCNERARLAVTKLHANNTKKVVEAVEFDMLQERHEMFRQALSQCTVALEELRVRSSHLGTRTRSDLAVHLGSLEEAMAQISCADAVFKLAAAKRPVVEQLPCPSPNCFSLGDQVRLDCGHQACLPCAKAAPSDCAVCELTREPTINDVRGKTKPVLANEGDPKALITIRMHENLLERVRDSVKIGCWNV